MGNKARSTAKNSDNSDDSDTFELESNQLWGYSSGSRRWRRATSAIAVTLIVALTLALAARGSLGSPPQSAPSPQPTTAPTAVPLITPPYTSPFLTPPDSLLAPIPAHCPTTTANSSAAIAEISYYADPAYGLSPVWVLGLSNEQDQRVLHFDNYPPLPYTAHGWRWRILLIAAPGYGGNVMLSGELTGSGVDSALLMDFTDAGSEPVTSLSLNASSPIMRGVGWAEWPIYVYLPQSGCYELGAHWPSGSWTINFAAGI
ncbi:MAG: hypothetical protein ACLQUY_16970 [Ktedonobacterales bacterium]